MQWGHILRIFVNVRFRHETLQSTTRSLRNRFFSRQLVYDKKKQVTTLKVFLVTPGFREQHKLEVSDLSRIPTLAAPPPPAACSTITYCSQEILGVRIWGIFYTGHSLARALSITGYPRPVRLSFLDSTQIACRRGGQFSGLYANNLPSRSVFWTLHQSILITCRCGDQWWSVFWTLLDSSIITCHRGGQFSGLC